MSQPKKKKKTKQTKKNCKKKTKQKNPQIYHKSDKKTWMTRTDVIIYKHITAFKTTVCKKIIYKKIQYDMLVAYLKPSHKQLVKKTWKLMYCHCNGKI